MKNRRWVEPESRAPERLRAALQALDAEPDAQSRARGWARFSAERTRRKPTDPFRNRLAIGAFSGAALVAAVITLNTTRTAQPDLTAVELEGQVFGTNGALEAGAGLQVPARVRVAPGGRAVLRTAHGDTLRIGEGAEIHLPRRANTQIDVSSGAVDVEASPRFGGERLVVVAGAWRVEVVGTRFTVDRGPRERVQVAVQEGRVQVVGPGYEDLLGPGDRFDSSPPSRADRASAAAPSSDASVSAPRPPVPRTAPSRKVARRQAPARSTTKPAPERTKRRLEPQGEEAASHPRARSTVSAASERSASNDPDSLGAATGLGRWPPRPGSPISLSRRRASGTASEARQPKRPKDDSGVVVGSFGRGQMSTQTARQPKRPKDDSGRDGQPDPALDQVAAYRAARALKDAGRSREAAASYAALIARWPEGELSQVAYLDEIECLLAANDVDGARRTERSFVAAFPIAASRPEASFVRAEVARALGEHRHAAALFAAAATADRFAEAAGFLEALSHARAGATTKARDAMQAYLRRFPDGAHAAEAKRALQENRQ